MGSREHPLGVHQDAPALEVVVMVQGRLPGLGMLTIPASDDPGLDGGHGACRGGAESGRMGVAAGGEGAVLWTCRDAGAEGPGQEVMGRAQDPAGSETGGTRVAGPGGEMFC